MPNWCEGNIRFRGACGNIKTLLENEIQCVGHKVGSLDVVSCDPVVKAEFYQLTVSRSDDCKDVLYPAFHIKGTRRNFLDGVEIEFHGEYDTDDDREVRILVCDSFKAAWGIEAEPYVEIANEYDVDIHIFGWEMGMEFMQEVEIVNGQLVKNEEIKYDDWGWNCPMPYLGG